MTASHSDIKALLAEELGAEALAGVAVTRNGDRLVFTFSHPYLCDYWHRNFHLQLERAVRDCLGQNLTIVYADAESAILPRVENQQRDYFADFLVSNKNSLALKAARNFCDSRETTRTLLLIGESGSGKSHLLRAMAKSLDAALGSARVLHIPATDLPTPDFWQQGRALLVDDIQFCTAKDLLAAHLDLAAAPERRLAATCVTGLPETHFPGRLRLRLQRLLQIQLPTPDLAVRSAWLERENERRHLGLTSFQLLSLARLGRHISQLEGLLQKFDFYSRVGGKGWAWEELERLAPPEEAQPWLRLFALVAAHFAVPPAELAGTSRKREIVLARQAAMYLCRQKLGLSYPELGRLFGGRDHATVIHSIKKIEQLRQVDNDLHNLLTELAEGLS